MTVATAVPDPIDLPYAKAMLDDALARLEEARGMQSASGQVGSLTLPSLTELREEVRYWTGLVRRLREQAAGASAPGFRVATWQ